MSFYNDLCNYSHPFIVNEGEFIFKISKDYKISYKSSFNEYYFIQQFRASSLTLATSLKLFEILYYKKMFNHLNNPYKLRLKEMAEQICDLMNNRLLILTKDKDTI